MLKKAVLLIIATILLLTSCAGEPTIVMPFEATFHKFVYILTKDLEEINTDENEVLCENDSFSVIYRGGCLSFFNKEKNAYYDTFGNEYTSPPSTGLNISVTQGEDYCLNYKDGAYYNSETDKYIKTFTAYKLNENTVRLLIVTGIDEFEVLSKVPKILTEDSITINEDLKVFYSKDSSAKEKILNEYPILEERLSLNDNLYYLTTEMPESAFTESGLTKNTSHETALTLNYNFNQVKMLLTTVDITLNNDCIIFDISKNRQFRSELIRDKSFKHSIFDFEIDFITKTASESEKITDAQSKY